MCKSKIVVCTCRNRKRVESAITDSILEKLQNKNIELIELEDLCGAAVTNTSSCKSILEDASCIIACSKKAVKAILSYLEVENDIDIKELQYEDENSGYIDTLEDGTSTKETIKSPDAWNPFIDKAICNDCGQCYEFCIFNVYTKDDDGTIVISNPDSCKDNCPACSRLCPQNAIVFPKHPDPSINGSKPMVKTKEPTEDMFKEDIMKVLAERRKNNNIFK